MPSGDKAVKPLYEPDASHREKHRGSSPQPAFVPDEDGRPLGKCSNEIDTDVAQRLLDEGVRWQPETDRSPWPRFIFNTYRGIPYRAHRRGRTPYYHGFPDIKARIPKAVRAQLRERAVEEGAEDAFDEWMRQTEIYD